MLIIKETQFDDLASYLADTFKLHEDGVKQTIYDWWNDYHSEIAAEKGEIFERQDLDKEQEDLTNSQM